MIYLLMSDGSRKDIPYAAVATVEDDCLVCRNEEGEIVETFDKLAVKAFSSSETDAKLFALASSEAELKRTN